MNLTVNFGSKVNIARCIKNHKPLSIIPMFTDNNTRYFIFDRQNRLFGAFKFDESGALSGIKFEPNRRKTAADALLTMKDFILKKAKAKGADFVDITILTSKKNAPKIKRLFSKFDVTEAGFIDGALKFIGILNPKKEFEIMSSVGKNTAEKATNSLQAVHILMNA